MIFPEIQIPITEIPVPGKVQLYLKREDLNHPGISGNKYWKLFYNVQEYLVKNPKNPKIISFGGAFSNHIAALAVLGKEFGLPTTGIIRGEELVNCYQKNPTLMLAAENGMHFRFVSRENYRDKESCTAELQKEFPEALVIGEGGTNALAVKGIQHMLGKGTEDFHYLCTAVGTGGTVAGISRFSKPGQEVIGFKMVNDASLERRIEDLSGKRNVTLIEPTERYGKITSENIRFINWFYEEYGIPLDPVYTGKMMQKLFEMIKEGFFPENSRILAFHTGGLQGISGANALLKMKNKTLIQYKI